MKATKQQKQYIHINSPNRDTKEEFVQWATEDVSKISCNDLSFDQANLIIVELGGKPHRKQYNNWGRFNKDDQQHRQILSLCIQYGWKKKNPKSGYDIADIDELGNWLEHGAKCPVNKKLSEMDTKETTKIIYALEKMVAFKFK